MRTGISKEIWLTRIVTSTSQQKLSQLTGISQSRISRIENGANVTVEELQKIADALHLPIESFIKEDENVKR